jgi:hypothetical protein
MGEVRHSRGYGDRGAGSTGDDISGDQREKEEQDVVERLLGLLGYSGFSVSNPNSSNEETGADLLVRLNQGKIGFQVTEYQPDTDKKGSRLREKEAVRAKVGLITAMSITPFSMESLKQTVSQKAKKRWSQTDFPDMRLVVAASVPQLGGTASTQLLPGRLKVAEMNAHLSPILEQTNYSAAYLYVMMHEIVYEWTRRSGWKAHPVTASASVLISGRRLSATFKAPFLHRFQGRGFGIGMESLPGLERGDCIAFYWLTSGSRIFSTFLE